MAWVHVDWQTAAVAVMGVGAVLHLARRWWPRQDGATQAGCGSCDQGCGTSQPGTCGANASPQPLQEQPIQLKTRP